MACALGLDLGGVRLGLGKRPDGAGAVLRGCPLGLRRDRDTRRVLLSGHARGDHRRLLLTLGNRHILCRLHGLGGRGRQRACGFRLGPRFGLRPALVGDGDGARLVGEFDIALLADAQRLGGPVSLDLLLLDREIGGDDRGLWTCLAAACRSAMDCCAVILASASARLASASLSAAAARVSAVLLAMSRCCDSSASFFRRWISSVFWVASRSCCAIATSALRTVWLRSCRLASVILVSAVRPPASKALLGLKNLVSVWSSLVSDALSSSRPFSSRSRRDRGLHAP